MKDERSNKINYCKGWREGGRGKEDRKSGRNEDGKSIEWREKWKGKENKRRGWLKIGSWWDDNGIWVKKNEVNWKG